MSDRFPSGETFVVDLVADTRGVGRRLHFVLPSGVSRWVNIGDEADTPQLRERIAAALASDDRRFAGVPLPPRVTP